MIDLDYYRKTYFHSSDDFHLAVQNLCDEVERLRKLPEGNGDNRFWIEVKCKHKVYDEEWAAILLLVNLLLDKHNGGQFSNVGAYLCSKDKP